MRHFLPAVLWALVILVGSAMPGPAFPDQLRSLLQWDKVVHAGSYGLLVLLTLWGARRAPEAPGSALLVLVVILFGAAIEGLQYGFFSGRFFEIFDILANCIGAFIGFLVFHFFTNNLVSNGH